MARATRPGGRLVLVEFHPLVWWLTALAALVRDDAPGDLAALLVDNAGTVDRDSEEALALTVKG
jgi:hypothetical protein